METFLLIFITWGSGMALALVTLVLEKIVFKQVLMLYNRLMPYH
jgi:hypothetical protein